jgi:hypothetical protein
MAFAASVAWVAITWTIRDAWLACQRQHPADQALPELHHTKRYLGFIFWARRSGSPHCSVEIISLCPVPSPHPQAYAPAHALGAAKTQALLAGVVGRHHRRMALLSLQ